MTPWLPERRYYGIDRTPTVVYLLGCKTRRWRIVISILLSTCI